MKEGTLAKYTGDLKMEQELEKLSWPEAPKIVCSSIPGPKSKVIFDKEMTYETNTRFTPIMVPCVWDRAYGATAKDPDGNLYVDLVGSVAVNGVGHCHPKIVEVLSKEIAILGSNPDMPNPNRARLGEKLSQISPGKLKGNVKVAYGLTGTSAVETAVKFAKKAAGRPYIVTFEGCYHGSLGTTLDMSTLGSIQGTKGAYRPFSPYVYHVGPYAYCYRCAFNLKYPACKLQCAQYVDFQLSNPHGGTEGESVAALFIEPMQAEGGYIHPPEGYLKAIKKICEKHGIIYVDEEVQAGMGRTAKMFTIEHHGVDPDMITLGKALGGDVPISAVIMRKELSENLDPASHVLSLSGNSAFCAVALTNIEIIQSLLDRAARLGAYIKESFEEMAGEREIIGEVRGKGLAVGVELVKNRRTKKPLTFDETLKIRRALMKKGVFEHTCGRYGNCLRISPPLTITKSLVDKSLEIISDVLKSEEKTLLE